MTYDPLTPLKRELSQLAKGGKTTKAEILNLFRLIRLILEAKRLRPRFPMCAMYCDWLQHAELGRNSGALILIEKIDSIFCVAPSNANFDVELRTILDALGLVTLRQELLMLFVEFSVPTFLLTGMSNWYTVVSVVLEDLVGRPLLLSVPPTSKFGMGVLSRVTDRRRSAGIDEYRHVYKVVISDERSKATEPGRPPGFYFNIFLSPSEPDRIQVNGYWSAQEGRDAFKED
ncbi:hypothetical protein [Azohydromonas aeria]|uniref:hypothetical protein n=1 Tax=Azohydromonas aeria TaxID=2590212 RepID=UPI0012F85924|nr:hypothetical protein [Azohydromonas aeria]